MSYLKFKSNNLFTGTEMLPENYVLITNKSGVVESIIDEKDAGDEIQFFNGIITPGFINAHCHLELSHMKGLIPKHSGLVDFILKILALRHVEEDEILQAIKNGEDEMLANGIVAVGDICNNALTITQKQKQRLAYYNFIEVSGWHPYIATVRFEKSMQFAAQYSTLNNQFSLSPHAPYSVSNNLWDLLQPIFPNKTVTIHNQETNFENDLFINGTSDFVRMYRLLNIDTSFFEPTGKTSLKSYFQKMGSAKNVLLVHNTFTNEADLDFIQSENLNTQQQTFFCLCVNANQYIENALPPIQLFRQHSLPIVLGTDSLASNDTLSIVDEMKTITKNFPNIPLQEILKWATINGAIALQMNDKFGSFEKGKKPGVVLTNSEFSMVKRLV